jgi:hypothetical protein
MTSNFYGTVGNSTLHGEFCSTSCSNDLKTYRADVVKGCANDPQPFDGYPATYWADWAMSAYEHLCMKDATTGQYCVGREFDADIIMTTARLTGSRCNLGLLQRLDNRFGWDESSQSPAVLQLRGLALPAHAEHAVL